MVVACLGVIRDAVGMPDAGLHPTEGHLLTTVFCVGHGRQPGTQIKLFLLAALLVAARSKYVLKRRNQEAFKVF